MNLKAATTAESAKFDESIYVIVLPRDEAEQIPAQFVTKSSSLRIVKIGLVSITYWGVLWLLKAFHQYTQLRLLHGDIFHPASRNWHSICSMEGSITESGINCDLTDEVGMYLGLGDRGWTVVGRGVVQVCTLVLFTLRS